MAGNGLIAVSKFVAAYATGSVSTMAEALHSVADTTNQVLLMVGLRRARRAPTALHPFGHAAETYFWPFLVSIMIFLVGGVFALYEGGRALFGAHGHGGGDHLWSYIVLGLALVFESYSFAVATQEFAKMKVRGKSTVEVIRDSKDPTIPVVLMEDAAALLGLVIALVFLGLTDLTGWKGFDGIGSMLIGLVLCWVAVWLGRETHSLLLGESASLGDRQKVVNIVHADEAVRRITQLLSMHRGPDDIVLALKVDFDPGLTMTDLEGAIDRVEAQIREALPQMKYIFIEPDARYDAERDERPLPVVAPPTS